MTTLDRGPAILGPMRPREVTAEHFARVGHYYTWQWRWSQDDLWMDQWFCTSFTIGQLVKHDDPVEVRAVRQWCVHETQTPHEEHHANGCCSFVSDIVTDDPMRSQEIQPCPFCHNTSDDDNAGPHVEIYEGLGFDEQYSAEYAIECWCGAGGPRRDSEVEATSEWNRITLGDSV